MFLNWNYNNKGENGKIKYFGAAPRTALAKRVLTLPKARTWPLRGQSTKRPWPRGARTVSNSGELALCEKMSELKNNGKVFLMNDNFHLKTYYMDEHVLFSSISKIMHIEKVIETGNYEIRLSIYSDLFFWAR
jgi:hypothetical protein